MRKYFFLLVIVLFGTRFILGKYSPTNQGGEFLVNAPLSVTVTAELDGVGYGWDGSKIIYIQSYLQTQAKWDCPKSQKNGLPYMPWGLIKFSIKENGTEIFKFTMDFRDENWATDDGNYPTHDTYLNIDPSHSTYTLTYSGGSTHFLSYNQTYQIWNIWGTSPLTSNFGTPVSGNLEQNTDGSGNGPSFRNVKILPVNSGTLYFAGTSVGLYMTNNLNGANTTWTLQAPNQIGNTLVETMDISPGNGYITVGTFGKGSFSANFNATGVQDKVNTPDSYQLAQNYPNPFNPSTTIEYTLKTAGNVSLRIYNSVGKLVETLQNGYENEGNHKVVFDSQNLALASGVYYYQIKTNDYNQTKKMVLLK